MNVYDKIDKLLEQKNLSRRRLAILADIPPTTLQSAFSRKTVNLSLDTIKKIADVLEVTPYDLMGAEYWDAIIGNESIAKLSKSVDLIESVENEYGEGSGELLDLFSKLNAKGKEKALDSLSDLTMIKSYTEK